MSSFASLILSAKVFKKCIWNKSMAVVFKNLRVYANSMKYGKQRKDRILCSILGISKQSYPVSFLRTVVRLYNSTTNFLYCISRRAFEIISLCEEDPRLILRLGIFIKEQLKDVSLGYWKSYNFVYKVKNFYYLDGWCFDSFEILKN